VLLVVCLVGCKDAPFREAEAAKVHVVLKAGEPCAPLELKLRETAIRAEVEAYDELFIRHDAAPLSEVEKSFWRALRDAAELVEKLYSLQLHPRSLEWRDAIMAEGGQLEKRLVTRNRVPWCLSNPLPVCTAIAQAPARSQGDGLWGGSGMTSQQVEVLAREINGIELKSPFTVVKPMPDRGFEAMSYARSELLGPKMRQLAAALEQAASAAASPSLAAFLRSRAASLLADEAFPYDASDLDWLAVEGDTEVTVGPYEAYDDPHGIKAMFLLVAGKRDERVEAQSAPLLSELPQAEEALATLVGMPLRDPSVPLMRPVIRAVNAWLVSGQARRAAGALSAYHLPNRGAAVDAGQSKKVLLVNHIEALAQGLANTARGVFGEAIARRVDAGSAVQVAWLHELAHGLGPAPASQVMTADGKSITLQQALGKDALFLEELKAMAIALWLVERSVDQGWTSAGEADSQRAAAMAQAFDLLTYPPHDPHARAAAALLEALERRGALSKAAAQGERRLVPEMWRSSIDALCQTVLKGLLHADTVTLRGVRAQAQQLLVLSRQTHENHRPVTLSYVIEGL
jgi:hypothetical protein